MDNHDLRESAASVVDLDREWAIYRCGHGRLHVALDRVMVTLTEDEFHALQDLMRRACQQFHGGDLRPHIVHALRNQH